MEKSPWNSQTSTPLKDEAALKSCRTEVWGPETTTESRLFVEGTPGWMESDAEDGVSVDQ